VLAVGDESVDVGEGELHRFDLQVLAVGSIDWQRCEVEVLQHAQRHLRGDALPVRRDLVQREAAIVLRQRLDPLRLVRRQVGRGQRTAMRFRPGGDGSTDLAAVERFAARRADEFEGTRSVGHRHALADRRRAAVRQEGLRKARLARQLRHLRRQLPLVLHDRRHAETALGDLRGRRHQLLERQLAEALRYGHPRRHGTRHADAVHAAHRNALAVLSLEVLARPRRWRRAAGVQAVQALAVPQDAESVRTQPVAARLDDRHAGCRGHGSIHRIAALLHDTQPGLRGQRVRRTDDVAGEDGLALRRVGRVPAEVRRCVAHVRIIAHLNSTDGRGLVPPRFSRGCAAPP
jgi:hypothetical protein